MIIYADEGAREGKYLAKGDEYRVVDFSERVRYKPTRKQCAPEGTHCGSDDELELLHNFELRIMNYASSFLT